jgi:hypothetical protein
MAIIFRENRPAVDIIGGTFERPGDPWSHLGDEPIRGRLEAAIAAVGRLDVVGPSPLAFLGTAFVVGPGLLLAFGLDVVVHEEGGLVFSTRDSLYSSTSVTKRINPF